MTLSLYNSSYEFLSVLQSIRWRTSAIGTKTISRTRARHWYQIRLSAAGRLMHQICV